MIASPRVSVIVPAHRAGHQLPLSLGALRRSTLDRSSWELIVVDDASQDDTWLVASRWADTVVRLPGKPHGPAYARNRGSEAARGEILVFVDADVCVHPDALARFNEHFETCADVTAVFGSYDAHPAAPGLASSFRNLLHHHVHQRDAGDAETFWAGCGAVRAKEFREVGMFDEWHYARPQIEDIELGRRMRRHDHRIVLDPRIQGTHLKRWTLRDIMLTDFRHRGVPWTRLILQERPSGAAGRALNISWSEKTCTAFAGIGWIVLLTALIAGALWPLWALVPLVFGMMALNRKFYGFLARARGIRFALSVLPLHLLYYGTNVISAIMGWLLHILLGEPQAPPTFAADDGMDLRTWPPRPSRPRASVWSRSAPAARASHTRVEARQS
jgi:glycosyltransferase involved in cell wall biosynthesis